jgi:hypothetical protein
MKLNKKIHQRNYVNFDGKKKESYAKKHPPILLEFASLSKKLFLPRQPTPSNHASFAMGSP